MSTKHAKKKLKVLYDAGTQDPHVLQLETSLSRATVYWTILSIKAGESLEDAKRSGRPPKLGSDDRRCVTQFANYYSAISAEEIGQKLFERRDVKVSARTIQRSLDKSGLSKVKRKNKPFMTDDHMVKRVSFCTRNLAFSFDNVMITDECLFYLHRNTLKYWTRRGTNPRIAIPKFSVSIMVWGALSEKGLYFTYIQGSLNSQKYCLILQEFIPYANSLFPDGWVLQQDGATCHTSKYTKEWCEIQNVRILQWPANSPDLSPIENICKLVKDKVEKKCPKNKNMLREYIETAAGDISTQN